MRWVKDGRVISPGEYIPLLERTGYVVMPDQYIWERVFERQRAMLDQGVETITCSVNVSRIDFELIDVAQLFQSLNEKYPSIRSSSASRSRNPRMWITMIPC